MTLMPQSPPQSAQTTPLATGGVRIGAIAAALRAVKAEQAVRGDTRTSARASA